MRIFRLLRHAIRSTVKNPSDTVTTTVASVLNRLLSVGLIDMEAIVRRGVLMSLDPTFDHHLAQAESLGALFIGNVQNKYHIFIFLTLFNLLQLSKMKYLKLGKWLYSL